MMEKYVIEARVNDKNSEKVGMFRYFFKVEDSGRAKGISKVIESSLNKGLERYYGDDCVEIVNLCYLEDVE